MQVKIKQQRMVYIQLTEQEAANLSDIMGTNMDIPKIVSGSEPMLVEHFMNKLFLELRVQGIFRDNAEWK